jgi:hypothetical protein
MRYRDITPRGSDRFRLPASHPILAKITLDPADWYRFQQLYIDNPAIRILGHNDQEDGAVIVHIGCASRETRRRLEDGHWG